MFEKLKAKPLLQKWQVCSRKTLHILSSNFFVHQSGVNLISLLDLILLSEYLVDRLNIIYQISKIIAAFELKFKPYNKCVFS